MLLKSLYRTCGMTQASELSGAELNYNTSAMELSNPDGKLLKKVTVIQEIIKADKIINICKLKTHGMAKMTGAVKNLFGIVPGTMKAEYHLNRPNISDFANALIDICLLAKDVYKRQILKITVNLAVRMHWRYLRIQRFNMMTLQRHL